MEISRELYDHKDDAKYIFKVPNGINEEVVRQISEYKKEPEWMLQKRLAALKIFEEKPVPKWGPDLSKLDLNNICFYAVADAKYNSTKWEDVPENIKKTFERLGIPEAERKALAGAGAQFDSQTVYHNLRKELREQGVIFEDMHVAVEKYPELVKKHFMTNVVSPALHKYAALHGAVWSGGTFIYVPKGVKVTQPLQAYFRMNETGMGQFEHTLIIVDEDAECHYLEGCFTKGTPIITESGYKRIEEITEKDKVLTHEGEYRKVKDLQRYKHDGELYEIEYYGDSTQKITTTPEHPFLFAKRKAQNDRNKEFKLEWNIPKYMNKKDYLAIPINQITKTKKERTFEIKKWDPKKKFITSKVKVKATPEFYRLIGYFLAEGSTMKEHYLCFDFNKKEREYIEDVKRCLKKVFDEEAYEVHHKTNNGTSVRVNSTKLARIFRQLGTKNYNKQMPQWMLTESYENQKQIILGWFRGDGNYYNKKHKSGTKEAFRINTTSETMTRQMRDILLRLGIFGFINKRNREKENRRTMYTLGITGDYMIKFGNLVGIKINKTINNHKRASMFGIDKKFAYVPIKKISKKKTKGTEVYNFGVQGHETYTAGSIIVHNCSAPSYKSPSLHAGCVEVIVKKGARMRYSSVENWSRNTYNLNTKRANVYEEGIMEWISGNLGSGVTMLYPASVLIGKKSQGHHITIAYAGPEQNQDTGAKIYHLAPDTTSTVKSKSISKDGGITAYRGIVDIKKGAKNAKCSVHCDAMMFDNKSQSNTYPTIKVDEKDSDMVHEATIGKISEDQIFYLMSRGLSEEDALKLIVSGFIEPLMKELPLEYAIEMNKLIQMEMEGNLG